MKKTLIAVIAIITLHSCYSYTTIVGEGPKGNDKVSKWNPYFIEGLIPGQQVDPKQLAQGSENYSVNQKLSFGNMIVAALTAGIYTPTTITVTK